MNVGIRLPSRNVNPDNRTSKCSTLSLAPSHPPPSPCRSPSSSLVLYPAVRSLKNALSRFTTNGWPYAHTNGGAPVTLFPCWFSNSRRSALGSGPGLARMRGMNLAAWGLTRGMLQGMYGSATFGGSVSRFSSASSTAGCAASTLGFSSPVLQGT